MPLFYVLSIVQHHVAGYLALFAVPSRRATAAVPVQPHCSSHNVLLLIGAAHSSTSLSGVELRGGRTNEVVMEKRKIFRDEAEQKGMSIQFYISWSI